MRTAKSENLGRQGEIRRAIIEGDLVDCMVALPGQLFYSTQIPVCLWFLSRDKRNSRFRDRRRQTDSSKPAGRSLAPRKLLNELI